MDSSSTSLQTIRLDFIEYLNKLNEEQGDNGTVHYNTENGIMSIFQYADEFKDYLQENNYADSSIETKSIHDILLMDMENGHLVDNKDSIGGDTIEFTTGTEPENKLTEEEIKAYLENDGETTEKTTEEAEQPEEQVAEQPVEQPAVQPTTPATNPNEKTPYAKDVQEVLDKIYSNQDAIDIIDLDGDGKLSDEEKAQFEKYVQGDKDELTVADLKKALNEIEEGSFEYNIEDENIFEEDEEDLDIDEDKEDTDKTKDSDRVNNPNNTTSPSGANNGGGGGGGGGGNSTGGTKQKDPNDIKNMSLDQLKKEQEKREGNVENAREAINDVYSGDNKNVSEAKESYETAKEEYEEQLKNDKNVSDELKTQQSENLAKIEEKQSQIDNTNMQINDKESQISETETAIASDEVNIQALEAALQTFDGASEDDPEKQKAMEDKKAEVEQKLQEAEAQKAEHEEQLEQQKEELEQLKTDLDTQEADLTVLEDERTKIEEQISETCSDETKEAMAAFNDAKKNVASVKSEELSKAQKTLSTAETSLKEVNDMINLKEARQTMQDNSHNDISKAIDWAMKYNGYSHGQIAQIFRELGYSYHDGLYCADFVSMVLGESVGYDNLPEWYANLDNKASCPRIQSAGRGHEISAAEAEPGDIVLFDWDGDGRADHVGLFMDNGDGVGNINTIEGNTEHGGVNQESRRRSAVCGIYSMRHD